MLNRLWSRDGCSKLRGIVIAIVRKLLTANGPQLRWSGPRALSIVFDPKGARSGVSTFYSVASLYDGAITIRNEPQ